MLMNYRIVVIAVSIIASAGIAAGDWPLDPTGPARKVSLGSRELIWTNTYAIMRDWHSESIEVIAEDSTSYGSSGGWKTNYVMESIVGPLATYREVQRTSDKRGSRITVRFSTIDTEHPRSGRIPIDEVFDDSEVIQALVQSNVVAPYVGDLAPETFREFGFRGDECGILRNLLTSWAILDFADGQARVRIILPSTEEYCGDYHETFDIEIAVAEEWLESIQTAKADGLLGLHLKGWRR